MKAGLYTRVSSERQAKKDLSIPAQLKALRGYASKRGWEIVYEFVEEAESARTAKRPAFQEMIALAKQKKKPFDVILVWKLSRFARNLEDSVIYKALLERRGIQLISINEQIDDSPAGKLLAGMIAVVDEFYSNNLAQDVKRGMREAVQRGFFYGGPVPIGYRIAKTKDGQRERSHLEIDEADAPVVKRAFGLYLAGNSIRKIAKTLNQEGFKSPRGSHWGRSAVGAILHNETYIGNLVWNRGNDIERRPNSHPALVSRKDFERVQQILKARSSYYIHPRRVGSRFLLSGLVYCGHCGARMNGSSAKHGRYRYYVCTTYSNQGASACKAKLTPKNKLEGTVIDGVREQILTEKHLRELTELVNEELQQGQETYQEELVRIEAHLAKARKGLSKWYALIEDGELDTSEIAPRLRELSKQMREEKQKRDKLIEVMQQGTPEQVEDAVVASYVTNLRSVLSNGSFAEQQEFLKSFIRKVEVKGPNLFLEYSLPIEPTAHQDAVSLPPETVCRSGRIR